MLRTCRRATLPLTAIVLLALTGYALIGRARRGTRARRNPQGLLRRPAAPRGHRPSRVATAARSHAGPGVRPRQQDVRHRRRGPSHPPLGQLFRPGGPPVPGTHAGDRRPRLHVGRQAPDRGRRRRTGHPRWPRGRHPRVGSRHRPRAALLRQERPARSLPRPVVRPEDAVLGRAGRRHQRVGLGEGETGACRRRAARRHHRHRAVARPENLRRADRGPGPYP